MKLAVIDFETYYDAYYSLAKMPTQGYILDDRFQVIGVSTKIGNKAAKWIDGHHPELITETLTEIIEAGYAVCAHNAMFDCGILALRYGLHPKLMVDTRMMANAVVKPYVKSVSLAALADHFMLPPKGDEVVKAKGKRLEDFSEAELLAYGGYCMHDTNLCREIYDRMRPEIPNKEMVAIHRVLEMFTKPGLTIDPLPLDEAMEEEKAKQEQVLAQVGGFTKSQINSNKQFAAALTMLGVDPPKKISPRTYQETFAFSKKDIEFLALREHDDPYVRALVEARLSIKSNIIETRSKRLKALAGTGAPLCVPTVYYAAHTGRLGGTDGINMQNLSRGSKLRKALCAPPGHKVLAADLSQIEARLTAWFCDEHTIIDAYRHKEDLYCKLASKIFRFDVNKEDHPAERFVGKTGELSLQYGSAERTFALMLLTSGQTLPPVDTFRLAAHAVHTYRDTHPMTRKMWTKLQTFIDNRLQWADEFKEVEQYKCVEFRFERVVLPNGMSIHYPDLERIEVDAIDQTNQMVVRRLEDVYHYNGARKKLYGAKLLENIIQALAGIVIREHWLELAKRYHIVLQVHDELVAIVKDEEVDEAKRAFAKQLRTPPWWAPDLPVDCEVAVGDNYLEAK